MLAHDPDRLSRRLAHQMLLLEEFDRAGVRVEFFTTPRQDTPEGQLLLNVEAVVAEYERLKIRERTSRGRREKARRGLVVSGTYAPTAIVLTLRRGTSLSSTEKKLAWCE